MKLLELIHQVDRSKENSTSADIDELCQELNLNEYPGWNEQFDKAVKGYWLVKWLCTDTWVGLVVYYMNDEPVAISMQTARRNPAEYEFVSLEAATKLRKFILECLGESEFTPTLINPEEELDPHYSVNYSTQLLVGKGMYKGREVSVVRECHRHDDPEMNMNQVLVRYGEGRPEFVIDMVDFLIPLHINQSKET